MSGIPEYELQMGDQRGLWEMLNAELCEQRRRQKTQQGTEARLGSERTALAIPKEQTPHYAASSREVLEAT